jgi:mutator protein MutT
MKSEMFFKIPEEISVVGCCTIVLNNKNEILLEKHRKKTPWYGYWIFPGGKLEANESLIECAKREVKEEVGIDVEIEKLASVFVSKESQKVGIPIVLVFFLAKPLTKELKIQEDEIKEAKWFSLDEIKNLKVHTDVIRALTDAGILG